MNGYYFTERVRKVLALAREESARLRHEYVGTEHLLLGLIRQGNGVAAAVLGIRGIDLDQLRETVESMGHGADTGPGPALHIARPKGVGAHDVGSTGPPSQIGRYRTLAAGVDSRGERARCAGARAGGSDARRRTR